MGENIIEIENISKYYRLGEVGISSFVDEIKLLFSSDKSKNIVTNVRDEKIDSNYIWALKDVTFSVKKGEVIGIIGKNGAGKSTLLKILSRITLPSSGEIKIKGRISSLLEVGTGFHPDLTGRDNIFLNGAILGMSKQEIKGKFDEIVDFSGVSTYIDTPVKRYSSGMYVRLAFAVAAHLETEVLIVDEVLAVGDVDFQTKCLGKMKNISQEGKTVLYVSHIIDSVRNLCSKAMFFEQGVLKKQGSVNEIISLYLDKKAETGQNFKVWEKESRPGNGFYVINSVKLLQGDKEPVIHINISEELLVEIEFEIVEPGNRVSFSFFLSDENGYTVLATVNNKEPNYYSKGLEKGKYRSYIYLYGNLLNNKKYLASLICFSANWSDALKLENVFSFTPADDGVLKGDYYGAYGGVIRPKLEWKTIKIQ